MTLRTLTAAIVSLAATVPAFAHPGHTAMVDGHTHTLADLAATGAVFGLLAVALGGYLMFDKARSRRRND